MELASAIRRPLAFVHLWIGLIAGLFIVLIGVSGAVVTFRPQIGRLLSPASSSSACTPAIDWDSAQRGVEQRGGAAINRIYAPDGADTRYHFRVRTDVDAVYTHVIYDACTNQVVGTAPLEWLDWIVDFHHNFLAGRTGRLWVGVVGIALLLSGIGGLALVLISRTPLSRVFAISTGPNVTRSMFETHRSVGSAAVWLLIVQAATGIGLCFPQALRAVVAPFGTIEAETRPPRAPRSEVATFATLGSILDAAQRALPDGSIREVRMPEGNGTVQVRMWRTGDFRSLGNNVVFVDRGTGRVVAADQYQGKARANRFIQAIAGLHYGEWGGLTYRTLYGLAGFTTLPLLVTGCAYWWLRKQARAANRRAALVRTPASSPLTTQS